jgi:hypothetical protein
MYSVPTPMTNSISWAKFELIVTRRHVASWEWESFLKESYDGKNKVNMRLFSVG